MPDTPTTPPVTQPITLDPSQEAALQLACAEPICIITGGPGTGKTTIIRALLDRLRNSEGVALAAPTGKAAKRMQEATGQPAKTIHRLLAYSPVEGFWYGTSQRLPHDVIVVDEASMIDVELFARLLQAIDERRTRLILVGDYNQLPSVGPGAILSDLVRSDLVPCARLTTVHRNAEGSWVCVNAPLVLEGEGLSLVRAQDFQFVDVESSSDVALKIGDLIHERQDFVQTLVPQRTGPAGADALNAALQARFNHQNNAPQWGNKSTGFIRTDDKVIHTKNNYELGVFNGETGVVTAIAKDELQVTFPDRRYPVAYTRADATALRLAYALTVHKSQGSEWPWVIVIVHSAHTYMLTRQLLYTAITRGKEGVIIVGNKRGIENALKCKRDSKRNTALCDRIRGAA